MKKIIKVMIVTSLAFIITSKVYARTITITEVSKEFNESEAVKSFKELGNDTSSRIDEENNKLDIYSNDEKLVSFDYGNDYIMYQDLDTVITEENADNGFASMIYSGIIMETILKISGYENKAIRDDYLTTENYNEYGLEFETEEFSFENENYGVSGDYLRKFRMSLNTEKIDALMEEYGEDIEEDTEDNENVRDLVPSFEVKETTESSVTFHLELDGTDTESEDTIFCSIYQSDTEDGEYKETENGLKFNCSGPTDITFDDLESDTTYYYKAKVIGGSNYSDVVSVTTKNTKEATTGIIEKGKVTKNPDTGNNMFVIMLIALLLFSFAFSAYFFRKSKANGFSI